MSCDTVLSLDDVWKKYSKAEVFHRSFREDFTRLLTKSGELKSLDEFWVLQGVSLKISRGECLCLLGPNGAGKSTLLKIISNVTTPDCGTIDIKGNVAPLIEVGAGFHPDLTGRQNIFMNGTIIGMKLAEVRKKLDEIIDFSELGDFIDTPVKKYSSGMYLKLAVAIAFHSPAEILLIDEILSVADTNFKQKCMNTINLIKKTGRSILLVSHDAAIVDGVSDRKVYIEKGQLVIPS